MKKLTLMVISGVMLVASTMSSAANQQRCTTREVPIYETRTVTTDRNAGADALAGMIIGGIIGKGVSGNDNGAAAGAVIGGIIGANEGQRGSTTRQERVIVGYKLERTCENVTPRHNGIPVGRAGEIIEIYRMPEHKPACSWEREYVRGHGWVDVQKCPTSTPRAYTVVVLIDGVQYRDTSYMPNLRVGDWWKLTKSATFN